MGISTHHLFRSPPESSLHVRHPESSHVEAAVQDGLINRLLVVVVAKDGVRVVYVDPKTNELLN